MYLSDFPTELHFFFVHILKHCLCGVTFESLRKTSQLAHLTITVGWKGNSNRAEIICVQGVAQFPQCFFSFIFRSAWPGTLHCCFENSAASINCKIFFGFYPHCRFPCTVVGLWFQVKQNVNRTTQVCTFSILSQSRNCKKVILWIGIGVKLLYLIWIVKYFIN